ncbi:tRNA pseudouridine(55) synthase TruB [Candidatus Vallotia tarda]|uniref:tRNA pseudouridine(55) synthase TruB n=1 Tax=Candidatus Vallotiella hemipterorum TaxID=1177213 RepID=UPI001C1FE7E5|nr:tRNA pseudouridine(55) synthase TruB [Candidatus Vallotia tarda]
MVYKLDPTSNSLVSSPIDGVLLLDKPIGLSSNYALTCAKRLLKVKKAGHTGTLDPLASGLLPLCFGEATKFSQNLLHANKTYDATLKLGVSTTTDDAEGEVLKTRPVTCDRIAVHSALMAFRGPIMQVPPMYSALKRNGKPLYVYARAGHTLEREARSVTIYALECITCVLGAVASITIRITCSKGTYIRALARDIGEILGCGAHLAMLRRTSVGELSLTDAVTLNRLSNLDRQQRLSYLQPIDALLSKFELINLDNEMAKRFINGQRLRLANKPSVSENDRVKVYNSDKNRLIGIGRWQSGVLFPERLLSTFRYY